MLLAEATFTLTSLWVVRRCGYRLVRITGVDSKPETVEAPTN